MQSEDARKTKKLAYIELNTTKKQGNDIQVPKYMDNYTATTINGLLFIATGSDIIATNRTTPNTLSVVISGDISSVWVFLPK
ncbi:hypothetical protein, partial [Bacillus cereus]|uniref:hypothetical protein n=1 Tax=Bacillus cereus TaxID=1396 RepID=UPI000BED9115